MVGRISWQADQVAATPGRKAVVNEADHNPLPLSLIRPRRRENAWNGTAGQIMYSSKRGVTGVEIVGSARDHVALEFQRR